MPPSRKCSSTRAVSELPLNGRDPMMLAVTTPGVLLGTKSSMTGIPPGNDFVGAGTREIQNSMSLDGISIMNNLITTTPTRPMVETVQEVEVQTGTYSAQYGAYMGVHINMVTKGGTNQFHGNVLEFLRNDKLDARNFFTLPTPANPTAKKPPLRQNQFGVEFDGPVVLPKIYNGRDKTFFMASYEGLRQHAAVHLALHPNAGRVLQRRFLAACRHPASPADPSRIRSTATRHFPAISFRRPASRRLRSKLQQYYPAPNLPGLASNFSVAVPSTQRYNQTLDRIDQNIGDKIRLYVRAHWQEWNTFGGSSVPVNSTTVPTEVTQLHGRLHAHADSAPGERFPRRPEFLQVRRAELLSPSRPEHCRHGSGNSRLHWRRPCTTIPAFRTSTSPASTASATAEPTGIRTTALTRSPNRSVGTKGSHNIMAGFEFRRLATGRAAVNSARGTFTFNGTQTRLCAGRFHSRHSGQLLQRRDRKSADASPHGATDSSSSTNGRSQRKLTLNYGLRYELPTVPYTINGNASFLNADQTALIVAQPGTGFIKPQHKNWAPRLGFAYRITEKTDVPRRRRHLLQPEPDQQLHVPQHQSAMDHDFQLQLVQPDSRRSACPNPFAVPARLPARRRQSQRPDRHAAMRSAHRPHESVERQSGTSVLERRRPRSAVSRLSFLSPGPQLLQQHSAARARAPSTSAGPTRISAARSAPSTTI